MKITKRWENLNNLWKMGNKDSYYLTLIPYEIHCGRHSGFPDCCIKFFITRWITKDVDSKFRKSYFKLVCKSDAEYIPCPKCLKNKTFIKVKLCPKTCRLKCFIWGKDWWKNKKFKK